MHTKRKLTRWRKADPCPCESDLTYGECCAPRGVLWQKDARGNPFRTVKIPSEFREYVFDAPLKEFRHIFRRSPHSNDRAFPAAYITDAEEFEHEFVKASEKVGVDPALTYAFRKTGRMIVEGISDHLPKRYLDEWSDAIDEYHDSLNDPQAKPSAFDEKVRRVMDEAVRLPYLFGKLLLDVNERPPVQLRQSGFPSIFALFCAARTAKSLQAIRMLVETQAAEDSLTIVRSMYEGYLHCVCALREPKLLDEVQRAKAGVHAGTHVHPVTRRGRLDYRVAVDIETGERLRAELLMGTLARQSPYPEDGEIYNELYSYLSTFAHPHFLAIGQFLGPTGFTSKNRELAFEAFLLANFVGSLVLDAIVQLPLPRDTRADIKRYLRYAKKSFAQFFIEAHRLNPPSKMQAALQRRTNSLGFSWPVGSGRLTNGAA